MTRHAHDFYETPTWVTDALLRVHPICARKILEPCAGRGAILRTMLGKWRIAGEYTAVEIREEERPNLEQLTSRVRIADFLTWRTDEKYDLIITNPPYALAQEIVERALEIAGGKAEVIMLLRLAFLESRKRYAFWKKHPLSRLYVLSDRPSFTGGGTDSAAYAWFVWNSGADQRIEVIGREAAVV